MILVDAIIEFENKVVKKSLNTSLVDAIIEFV